MYIYIYIYIIFRVFCPRAGLSLQMQEPKWLQFCPKADLTQEPKWLQFCPKADLPQQTQEPRLQFYQGLNRYGSFPLLFATHSLFSIWIALKRSEKIPGDLTWMWGEWIWLIGPSELHQNLPVVKYQFHQVFDQIRDPEITITLFKLLSLNHRQKREI